MLAIRRELIVNGNAVIVIGKDNWESKLCLIFSNKTGNPLILWEDLGRGANPISELPFILRKICGIKGNGPIKWRIAA